jgi:DNA repair exonuclease SbcCD ATPase subunit
VDPLEQAAGQLYGEAPSGFIAARNALAAEAKAAGERELAAGIRSLAKPSVAAWAVNALVRHRPGEVQPLLELGERMRDATESGDRDAVRQLGRERQQLLAAAASSARALGDELGVAVSDAAAVEVQQTLQAAVVDPAATAAVRSGLLVRTFSSTGVDPVELDGAVALAGAGAVEPVADPSTATRPRAVGRQATEKKPAAKAAPEESREQVRERAAAERASRALAAAKREAEEARQDAEDAQAELATTELRIRENRARHEQLAEEQQELRERLDAVQGELTDTNVTAARLRKERASAVRAAEAAERLASRARTRLASLTADDDLDD